MTSKRLAMCALMLLTSSAVWASCESGYNIQTKSDDGSIITLSDGSTWRVSDYDQVDSSVWVDGDEVLVCDDGTLINKDEDNEQVDVVLLSR